jgi:hypothetical protein
MTKPQAPLVAKDRPLSRAEKLPLPRYGEMEKRFDDFVRGRVK